jgi:hypothetical protein
MKPLIFELGQDAISQPCLLKSFLLKDGVHPKIIAVWAASSIGRAADS